MKNKLRDYIDQLFQDTPKSKRSIELREELLSNLSEKYDDLIQRGYSEEDAYQAAISGIGDVGQLIDALGRDPVREEDDTRWRKTNAVLVSCSVMLYILSVIPLFILQDITGLIVMFALAALATGLIVFSFMSRPKYHRADETVVEEFKEWQSDHQKTAHLQKSISSIIWPLIVVLYFFVSFRFGAWAYSWILFILGAAVQNIIKLIIDMKGNRQ